MAVYIALTRVLQDVAFLMVHVILGVCPPAVKGRARLGFPGSHGPEWQSDNHWWTNR